MTEMIMNMAILVAFAVYLWLVGVVARVLFERIVVNPLRRNRISASYTQPYYY